MADRATGSAKGPQQPQSLELGSNAIQAKSRQKRLRHLKHDRSQIRQLRNDFLRELEQRRRNRPRVRVQPVAGHLEPACKMYLPHAVQRNLRQERFHALASVPFVRVHIVEIEEDAAVRGRRQFGDELPIGNLIVTRPEIVHASLEQERHVQFLLQPPDRLGVDLQALLRLPRRQEEAGEMILGEVE